MGTTVKVVGTTSLEIIDTSDFTNDISVGNSAFENFHKICRFCFGFDNLKPFFNMTYQQVSVQGIISDCSSLKANPEDCLPYNLCLACIADLIKCYKFKKRCIQATNILQDAYNNGKYGKTTETTTQCYGDVVDGLIIKNEEIEDAPTICNDDMYENNSKHDVDPTDESYRSLRIKTAEMIDILQDAYNNHYRTKAKETVLQSNNSGCYGGALDNMIFKNESIEITPKLISGDTINREVSDNMNNWLDLMGECCRLLQNKIAEMTNIIQNSYNDRYYIKTEETTILSNNSEYDGRNFDNFIIKNEGIEETATVWNDISVITSSYSWSENDSRTCQDVPDKSYKPLQSKTNSKFPLHGFEHYFKTPDENVERHKQKYYRCELCDTHFWKDEMTEDFNEKPDICRVCTINRENTRISHTQVQNECEKESYTCSICRRSFTRQCNFTAHMQNHICEKLYKNSLLCDTDKNPLDQKEKSKNERKSYECCTCKKSFTYRSSLRRHMLIHTGEKPHKCSVCNESFVYTSYLKQHMLIHKGGNPHECGMCKKTFISNSGLKLHMLTHTGEKPFECSVCKKSFIAKANLKEHALIHMGERLHKCSVCEKCFVSKERLKKHAIIHTNEKLHTCGTCKRSFRWKSNLNAHMSIHLLKIQHHCSICNEAFVYKVNLMEHMLVHTDEKNGDNLSGSRKNRKVRVSKE